MKSMIEKVFSIKALLSLLLVFAASGAWAAASLEETGATVPTTATLAFKGATLSQLTARTLSGVFGGSWAGSANGSAVTFNNFDRTSEASGTITCQAQVAHDSNVKGVLLTFTQSGDNVNVQKTGAKYVSGSAVGPSVASGTNGEYDVSELKLKLTGAVPNACWVGNFPSSQTTNVGGVSINPVNGSSTVSDGIITYGNPNNANGPAFWFDAVGYVAVVFTVDFTGVTLAENQLLVSFGNSSYNTLCGAALKSDGNGAFYATGVWANGAWTNTDDTSNTFTLSGEKTFIATYDKGDSANKATRLYILEDGVAKAIYIGSNSSNNLKGGDVTKFGIAGAYGSSGSFKNMAGLKLKKMAMYLSSSSLPVTASDLPNHLYTAKYSVANGETINASTINSGVTTFGCAYVSTEAGATINLDAALDGHGILFDGSISGVPATGLTLGSVNDTVTVSNVSYAPLFKGSGTVSFPDKTLPTETSWMTDSSAWTGTVILNNCGADVTGTSGHGYVNLASYGNENSFIRAPGYKGYTKTDLNCTATLVIESGETFTLTDGNSSTKPYFSKVKGSGTLAIAKGRTGTTQYVVGDLSLFTGTVTVASDAPHSIVLGGTTSWSIDTSYNQKLVIAGDATIASNKTWTASNGIVINGTLTLEDSSTSLLSGPLSGSGEIVCVDLPDYADLTDSSKWTGTVTAKAQAYADLTEQTSTRFMNANSKLNVVLDDGVAVGFLWLSDASTLSGTIDVASNATLYITDADSSSISLKLGTIAGVINMSSAAATTLNMDLGTSRPAASHFIYPGSLTTLNLTLKENLADDTELVFSVGNGTTLTAATVTMYGPDGSTVNNTATAALSADGHFVTVTYTPTVSGNACWIAYEMDYESGNASKTGWENSGTDTTVLHKDSNNSVDIEGDNAFYNGMLYTYAHPYRDNLGTLPDNWTAVVRCTVPNYENAAVITFGWYDSMIGLVAGEDPETEMRLIRTTSDSQFETLATMKVEDATTAQHVYIFSVENGATIKVYCDGRQVLNRTFDPFTLTRGFQVGSALGGVHNTGVVRFGKNESPANTLSETVQKDARIDCVRLYKSVLGANAIRQLSAEFPSVELYKATIAADDTTTWGDLAWENDKTWSGGGIYSKIILTVAGDASLTLPSTITAEDFQINVASDHVLTLNRPAGGTTITTTNPMEINNGTMYLADDTSLGTWEIAGTGTVRLPNGTVVSGALSGTAKIEIPSETTVAVFSGGSIANTLTGVGTLTYQYYGSIPNALTLGDWTGAVVLPGCTVSGINFNNFGKSGSKVVIAGAMTGWIAADVTFAPEIQLDANLTVDDTSSYPYTFTKISGTGNFSFSTKNYQPGTITITALTNYTGIVSNNTTSALVITTLAKDGGTSTASGTKLLDTNDGNITVTGVTIGGVSQNLTLYYATDGVYVDGKTTTEGAGEGAVTTIATSNDTTTVTIALPADYAGSIVVPPNVESLATSGTSIALNKVAVKYGNIDISGAFTIDGSAGDITLALDPNGAVGGVKVQPEVKTDESAVPMSMGASAATFTVKAIPGLWYSVEAADTIDGLSNPSDRGTPVQADSTTVNPVAPAFTGTVKYYRIKVSTTGN